MLVGLVPCVILTFGLFFIPESPRWLVRKSSWYGTNHCFGIFHKMSNMNQAKERRQKEFETALQKLRGEDVDVSQEAAEIQVLLLLAWCYIFPNIWSASYFISITLMHNFSLTGLCNNPWTTPKTQSDRFVSEDVLALSHCKIFIWTDFWLRFTRTSWLWSTDIQQVSWHLLDIYWIFVSTINVKKMTKSYIYILGKCIF